MKLSSLHSLRRPAQASSPLPHRGGWTCLRTPRCRHVVAQVTEQEAEKAATESVETGLAQITKQILANDPEARESLRRYEEAVVRLEKAKAASEELDRMFAEASKGAVMSDQQAEEAEKQRAKECMADAEVAAAERLLQAAELEYAAARQTQDQWANAMSDGPERLESVKAAAIAAAAGLLAKLPLETLTVTSGASGSSSGLSAALSLLSVAAASFLFGVTYRYAVRSDLANKQLRLGVVAAFGLVRASGAADVLQAAAAGGGGADGSGPLSLAVVGPAALYALESMLVFGFAALALEIAFSSNIVKRFGPKESS